MQRGLWFDGKIALGRQVSVVTRSDELVLVDEAGERHPIDPNEIVRLESSSGTLKFGHRSLEGWRLMIDEPVHPQVRRLLPVRVGSVARGFSRGGMAILLGLSAVTTAAILVLIFAPGLIAERMPMSWERKLGAVYELPIDARKCEDAPAREALDAMVHRLDPQALADGYTVDLVQFDMVNALALPGGKIVLFTGMVEEAGNADAIAGIVAHEIAHVRQRHVATAIVRELGLGTIVTLFGGGAVAANAGNLFSLRYSRSAEAEADGDAIGMLRRAGIDPRPTAGLFERLASSEAEGGLFGAEFVRSHPVSSGRARQFAAAADPEASYQPAISDSQAQALSVACSKG